MSRVKSLASSVANSQTKSKLNSRKTKSSSRTINKVKLKSKISSKKTAKKDSSRIKKGSRSPIKKRSDIKNIKPRPRAKSVLVDVIEDEPLDSDISWLANEDLKFKNSSEDVKNVNLNEEKEKNNQHFDRSLEIDPLSQEEILAPQEKLDKQKEYFGNLMKNIKNRKKEVLSVAEIKRQNHRRVILYRRLVIRFIILLGIVVAVVSFFSFSKLNVDLKLKGEQINSSLLLKIVDDSAGVSNVSENITKLSSSTSLLNKFDTLSEKNDPREMIPGNIKIIEARVFKKYSSNGEKFLGNEIKGRVNIINNYYKNQPLVAKTRLLTPDNKLYRIKNAVNVPAGGQVGVDIYVSKPSPDLAIGASSFTIPGLWVGLQDKIYARSATPFTYNQKIEKYVNASDLAFAAQDINKALINAAKAKANLTLSPNSKWLYIINDPATITIDAKLGEKKNDFSAQAVGNIVAVSFSRSEVAKLAEAKLKILIPNNKELTNFDSNNITYTLENYDPLTRTATVRANFAGIMILKNNSAIISPKSLLGLTANQIKAYLSKQSEISSYTLKFSPSFIKRAPQLVDRIKINIDKD